MTCPSLYRLIFQSFYYQNRKLMKILHVVPGKFPAWFFLHFVTPFSNEENGVTGEIKHAAMAFTNYYVGEDSDNRNE